MRYNDKQASCGLNQLLLLAVILGRGILFVRIMFFNCTYCLKFYSFWNLLRSISDKFKRDHVSNDLYILKWDFHELYISFKSFLRTYIIFSRGILSYDKGIIFIFAELTRTWSRRVVISPRFSLRTTNARVEAVTQPRHQPPLEVSVFLL